MPDSEIDYSDIPEITDQQIARARRGRPVTGNAKKSIALRVDLVLLADLKRMARNKGKPYQTLIHEILVKAVKRTA